MPVLHITCFGVFQASLNGQPITAFGTDKVRALLAYLAVESAAPQSRPRLAGLLWADQPEERALHNLRQALSTLRKALPDPKNAPPFLLVTSESVQFNPRADAQLDVRLFHLLLDQALRFYQRHNPPGGPSTSRLHIGHLQQAIELYQGPFLDQMNLLGAPLFDEWIAMQREDAQHRMAEALNLLAETHERRGEYAPARQALTRLVSIAPWEETAHSQLMRLLALDGLWSAAQAQYQSCRRYLQEQLGVEPVAETAALFNEIRRAAARNTPFSPTYPPAHHNLPPAPNAFVGRSTELDALADAIADPHCRMLTIVGPGGIGKTRLALEAARTQVGIWPDGVFFVPLAAVTQGEQLPQQVGSVLGFVFSERGDPQAQLLDYLRSKHLLILFDNFEHLLPHTTLLVEILQHAPGIMLVVTSRERLNLREECVIPLEGLAYPLLTEPLATPENFDALALFARRARQVQPQFTLDTTIQPAVIRLCQMLDGLPLGVELAAAALWNQTCDEIVARLTQNLDALSVSFSNVPPRHRSLRAVFDASWQTLGPTEQPIFCQLSVFRGGFEPAAAQQVAGAPTETLTALVDKSLVRRLPGGRYDLHEAVRQYAAERLAETSLAEAAHQRHAETYAALLVQQNTALKSYQQLDALNQLALESENLRHAWLWLAEHHQAELLAASADSLYHFLNIHSRFSEGITLFQSAARELSPDQHALAMGIILACLGGLAYRARQNSLAYELLTRSQSILTGLGATGELAFCLVSLGGYSLRQRDYAAALACGQESLEGYRQRGDVWGELYVLYVLGLIKSRQGRDAEAMPLLEASIAAARQTGDQRRLIAPLNILADAACNSGDYTTALTLFNESLDLSRKLNDRFNQAILLNNLASVYQIWGQYTEERAALEESLALCREIGDIEGEAVALNSLGEMCSHQQKYPEAIQFSQQALQIARQLDEKWTITICLVNLGRACVGMGQFEAARQHLQAAYQLSSTHEMNDLLARTALWLGRACQLQGQFACGSRLLQAALAHPAMEDEFRQIATPWLAEMGHTTEITTDENALPAVLAEFLS